MLNRIRACATAHKALWQLWREIVSEPDPPASQIPVKQLNFLIRYSACDRAVRRAEEQLSFFDWLFYIVALEVAKRKWAKEAECVAAKH